MIFLNGCVTGMTEMTKERESRTLEQMTEVYGLAVILVICIIFKADERTQPLALKRRCERSVRTI